MATKPLYLIVSGKDGGSGSFLCPPGHPNLTYSVHGYWGGRIKRVTGPDLIAALDYLIEDEYHDVPADVKARAQRIFAESEMVCSEAWVRGVYGYFKNSYSPDGVDRNVSNAVSVSGVTCACGEQFYSKGLFQLHINRALTHMLRLRSRYTRKVQPFPAGPHHRVNPSLPPEHHLGYLMVKSYFPDHEPRLDLIANPGRGYGNYPCDKCGQRVQYEARHDAWCVVITSPWSFNPDCPKGGHHEVAPVAPATSDQSE